MELDRTTRTLLLMSAGASSMRSSQSKLSPKSYSGNHSIAKKRINHKVGIEVYKTNYSEKELSVVVSFMFSINLLTRS